MDKTKALYEKPEETGKPNSSALLYPTTKREALDAKEIGANVKISKGMGVNLISYFQSIGADKQLPSDKQELVGWINRFHSQVAINNPLWPENLPFEYVYGAFINAIMYDRVSLKGYNIKAHIKAFKSWFTQSGVEDRLMRDYYKNNLDERPKELAETTDTKLEDWPDSWIKSQYETIEMISEAGFDGISLFDSDDADSYFKRIKSEYNKRFN